ncbi:hypothetical protein EDD18DRAFT_1345686 [Armillaria luteobubalina]|uniref:Uncharacterized protein n=1 Tax=Armillaria luteobubalina TaxID=153913 RepID=A0AA39UTR9_9AGAR|nr:hypothetical protein EDD18DRAFT_1345686 [Armillaria luteobubalina]
MSDRSRSQHLDVALSLQEHVQPHADPKACLINNDISTMSTGIGIAISELILIVRTCALYGNGKKVVYGLGTVWTFGGPGIVSYPHFSEMELYIICVYFVRGCLALTGLHLIDTLALTLGNVLVILLAPGDMLDLLDTYSCPTYSKTCHALTTLTKQIDACLSQYNVLSVTARTSSDGDEPKLPWPWHTKNSKSNG